MHLQQWLHGSRRDTGERKETRREIYFSDRLNNVSKKPLALKRPNHLCDDVPNAKAAESHPAASSGEICKWCVLLRIPRPLAVC